MNISIYRPDGMGRDGYIRYNNGGFWNPEEHKLYKKADFPHSLFCLNHKNNEYPIIWSYKSDGSGRDSYVFNNGSKYEPLINQKLSNFLRIRDCDNKKLIIKKANTPLNMKSYFKKINILQKNITNRLYNESKINFNPENLKQYSLLKKNFSFNKLTLKNSYEKNNNYRTTNKIKHFNSNYFFKRTFVKTPNSIKMVKHPKVKCSFEDFLLD